MSSQNTRPTGSCGNETTYVPFAQKFAPLGVAVYVHLQSQSRSQSHNQPIPRYLSELHGAKTPLVVDVLQFQLLKAVPAVRAQTHRCKTDGWPNSLFASAVVVDTAHLAPHLVEADVVEALKARPIDHPHSVVWYEEVLLPPHEYVLPLGHVADMGLLTLAQLLGEWPKGGEFGPVREVDLVGRTPRGMFRDEAELGPDELTLEVGREGWVVVGQA